MIYNNITSEIADIKLTRIWKLEVHLSKMLMLMLLIKFYGCDARTQSSDLKHHDNPYDSKYLHRVIGSRWINQVSNQCFFLKLILIKPWYLQAKRTTTRLVLWGYWMSYQKLLIIEGLFDLYKEMPAWVESEHQYSHMLPCKTISIRSNVWQINDIRPNAC